MAVWRRFGVAVVVVTLGGVAACSSQTTSAEISASSSSVTPITSSAPSTVSPADAAGAARLEAAIGAARNQAFLGILLVGGIQYGSLKFADDQTLVRAAERVCADLKAGKGIDAVVAGISSNYGGDTDRGRYFTREAISSFCPERSGLLPG